MMRAALLRHDAQQVAPCLAALSARLLWQGAAIEVSLALSSVHRLMQALGAVQLPGLQQTWRAPRQASYIAGRLCAEAAVLALTGEPASIGRAPGGEPVWPEGLVGSISHDADTAVAVAARRTSLACLGVDVEQRLGAAAFTDIVAVCLTAEERQLNARHAAPLWDATLRFSAKEAYYKAVHPQLGRFLDFHDVQVEGDTAPADQGVFALQPVLQGDLPRLAGAFRQTRSGLVTLVYPPGACQAADAVLHASPWGAPLLHGI
ncbi:4'-phosphopantetheinyl transferase family protein [Roseateles sp. DB2]|uniref:4'-phosphopantetheinyl transferase family protein n=1 Tax=Roseateles sp. DB2 TaxID=3453717 RepID=UPI003EEC65CB